MTRKYDMLFVCDEKFEDKTLTFSERIPHIKAFMSIQLGECRLHANAYAIRLVCSRTDTKSAGYGSFLIGALLYCSLFTYHNLDTNTIENMISNISYTSSYVLREEVDSSLKINVSDIHEPYIAPLIVLEALDGYTNPSAICTYEKFGFRFDESLLDEDCFHNSLTYPMVFDVRTYVNHNNNNTNMNLIQKQYETLREKIVNMSVGKNAGFDRHDICKITGMNQLLLGYLQNLAYKIEYEHKFENQVADISEMEMELHTILEEEETDTLDIETLKKTIKRIQTYMKSGEKNKRMDALIEKMTDIILEDVSSIHFQ
jgi:hypothetical protein